MNIRSRVHSAFRRLRETRISVAVERWSATPVHRRDDPEGPTRTRRRAILCRVWPVLVVATTMRAVALTLGYYEFTPADDGWLILYIGVAYLVALAYLLRYNEDWSLRGMGQLATYFTDAMLYGLSGLKLLHWRHAFTPGELNDIRAGFMVGGTCLMLGLFWFGFSTRQRGRWRRRLVRCRAWAVRRWRSHLGRQTV